jgi:hypothetical protein
MVDATNTAELTHSHSGVGPHFEIPAENSRIKIHTPVKVLDNVPVCSRILCTGSIVSFNEKHGTKRQGKDVHATENVSKFIVNTGGVEEAELSRQQECSQSYQVRRHSISLVDWEMSVGSQCSLEAFPWNEPHER